MEQRPTLTAGNIVLRAPRPEDVAARLALGVDLEIVRMFGGSTSRPRPPPTADDVSKWLDGLRQHTCAWVVEHDGRLLGEARLDGINNFDQRARLAVGFYDAAKLGKGLGRKVVHLVLRHAFKDLGLHRVDLRVLSYNLRAIRCYKRCGFIEEGRERESAFIDGRRYDDLIMGILAGEHVFSVD